MELTAARGLCYTRAATSKTVSDEIRSSLAACAAREERPRSASCCVRVRTARRRRGPAPPVPTSTRRGGFASRGRHPKASAFTSAGTERSGRSSPAIPSRSARRRMSALPRPATPLKRSRRRPPCRRSSSVRFPYLSAEGSGHRVAGHPRHGRVCQRTYTINAAGLDIWNNADQFHFIYQQITGDADVRVRVRSVVNAHNWSKSGVMIRESLSPGSRHASPWFQRTPDTHFTPV